MAESFASPSVEPPHRPEDVARRDFPTVRRGYDQMQVRAYLAAVASALRMAHTREAELRSRLASAVKRAHEAEKLDESTLTRRLGDETVRVLDTAREAAASIVANAEDRAATLVGEAEERAGEIEARAENLLAERTAEAEAAAGEIRRLAEEVLAEAEERGAELVEAGRREGEELIAEARLAREHILRDMDRRRRAARAQVERLKAGRDKLLGAFDTVQATLDEATSSLHSSLREAKVAADNAARRVVDVREPGIVELEAEVEAARLAGLVPGLDEASPSDDAELAVGPVPGAEDAADEDAAEEVAAEEDPAAEPVPDEPDAAGRVSTDTAVEPDAAGGDVAGEDVAGPVDEDRYEPRPVALNPNRRAGRRLRRPPVSADELGPPDLQTVATGDPVEEVRVVAVEADESGAAAEVAPEPVEESPEPVEDRGETDAATSEAPVEIEEPAEPAGGVTDDAPAETEVEDDAQVQDGVRDEDETEVDVASRESGAVEGTDDAVDALFARLRDDREAAVEAARRRLGADADLGPTAESGSDDPDGVPVADDATTERDPAERVETVERRLKRVLAEDQNRVLDGVRRSADRRGGHAVGVDDLLAVVEDQVDEYLGAVVDHLCATRLAEPAEDRLRAVLRRDLVEPLREAVEASLGTDADTASVTLRGLFRQAKTEWIPPLAERLVARADELSGLG